MRDAGYPYAIVKDLSGFDFESLEANSLLEVLSREHFDERASRRFLDGADGDRTHDLRLAKPALSQLSYSPF